MSFVTPLFIQNIGPMGMLVIAVVVLVLFGRGKITNLMGEVGRGITAFRKGVSEGKDDIKTVAQDNLDAEGDNTITKNLNAHGTKNKKNT